MSGLSVGLVVAASLLLLAAFFFPLWRFDLEAPQYPEGISLVIWVNGVGGQVDLVNALNHYIGMRPIDPAAFPELRFMPWIIAALIISGLLVAAAGRRRALVAWLVVFALAGAAALVDFQLWLYRYGHDLNPDAPLEMEPFTPPIIGSTEVWNFGISAYPDVGGLAVVLSLLLGAAALVLARRPKTPIRRG